MIKTVEVLPCCGSAIKQAWACILPRIAIEPVQFARYLIGHQFNAIQDGSVAKQDKIIPGQ
jgi:hypothetical protein